MAAPSKTFSGWGRSWNRAGDALALARPRRLSADVASAPDLTSRAPLFALLLSGFDVVMTLAEALQIVRVCEHIPVAAMRNDVVNDRRRCAMPGITRRILPRALTAARLAQKLRRAEPVRPDGQHVPAVVSCACLALLARLMLVAPAVARQHAASRVVAGSKRFARHGLSPPLSEQTTKSRSRQHNAPYRVYHRLRLSKHWPSRIFILCSVLQSGQ